MKLLTTAEVATICKVSDRTVENWRRRGKGPKYIKLETGQIRYKLSVVLRFLASYRKTAAKGEAAQ